MLLKFKCITVLAFLIVECYVLSLSAWLNIERGDRDVFDNPNCDSPTGGGCRSCDGLKATCVGNCKRCKCSETYRTFLPSYATNGQCVKNRRLLFLSPNASFLVERISSRCMKPINSKIERTSCDATDSSQRWIWTRNNQLMHADTLQCLERGPRYRAFSAYWYLVLGKCISTDTEQRWQCQGNANFLSIKWDLFMYMDNSEKYLYGIKSANRAWKSWRRFPSNQRLCSKAFGCYDFVTPLSAVLVTDARQCPQQCLEKREIYVPYKSEESLCFVNWEKLQYLDNYNWRQLPFRDEIFTIDNRNQRIYLQINFTKATNDWTGLIVKLNFYCAKKNLSQVNVTDTKCVVIKFKGTSIDPPTVKPTKVPTTPSSASTSPEKNTSTTQDPLTVKPTKVPTTSSSASTSTEKSTSTTQDPTNDTNSTATVMTDTKLITNYQITSSTSTSIPPTGAAEKHKSDSSNVTIIAVCVVIAILILCGILGFVFYKRGRRPERETIYDNAVVMPPDVHVEPMVAFRASSASVPDDSGYEIPNIKKTVSPGQAGALTAKLQHKTRWNNRDVEDYVVIDDPGYEIPNRPDMKTTLSQDGAGALYAQPEGEEGDNGGYVNDNDMEDGLGYLIPADEMKTTLGKDDDSSTLKGDARDSDENGHYQSLKAEERYEHVYQGLLPTTNR